MENLSRKYIYLAVSVTLFFVVTGYHLRKKRSDNNSSTVTELTISVSIAPIKYLVDRITGGIYPVNMLLPAGSSPETYEPTPKQLKELESSPLLFVTGLIDFENSVALKLTSSNTSVVALNNGIEPIEGECSHSHEHSHSHGVDPHIWASLSCLKIMSAQIMQSLPPEYMREEFNENYTRLIQDIDNLDKTLSQLIRESGTKAFLIYHPALSYYARDYGLEQIQLEQDGKESSADKLIRTISQAKELRLNKVLYQKEFSIRAVETAAGDIGAVPVEIDPLAEDILSNLLTITRLITDTDHGQS